MVPWTRTEPKEATMNPSRTSFSLKSAIPIGLLLLLVSILCAKAGQDVTVKIPFDFQAGNTHFAPGTYILSLDHALAGSVTIQSADHSLRATLLTGKSVSSSVESAPVVMFRTYGDVRFLSAIQGESASRRWEIVASEAETTLARMSPQPVVASFKAASLDTGTAAGPGKK